MPTISTLNSIAIANVSSYSTRTKASISTINGITIPSAWNTPTYWYFMWWWSWASNMATADRLTFSTSVTAANTASNLSTARRAGAWVSDKVTYWYIFWWYSTAISAIADRLTFSTSVTAANTASNLSTASYSITWISDWSTYWYSLWWVSWAFVASKLWQRITFSTWAFALNTASDLSWVRYDLCSSSDWTTYWYCMWWNSWARVATTDRLTFSTSVTAANTASNLSQARDLLYWLSNNSTYWYACWWTTGANVVTTDRITFSTSATAAYTTWNLWTAIRQWGTGVSDWSTYWYISWWVTSVSTYTALSQRMTFSTGSFATNTTSNLSWARWNLVWNLADYAV